MGHEQFQRNKLALLYVLYKCFAPAGPIILGARELTEDDFQRRAPEYQALGLDPDSSHEPFRDLSHETSVGLSDGKAGGAGGPGAVQKGCADAGLARDAGPPMREYLQNLFGGIAAEATKKTPKNVQLADYYYSFSVA